MLTEKFFGELFLHVKSDSETKIKIDDEVISASLGLINFIVSEWLFLEFIAILILYVMSAIFMIGFN